MKIRKWRKTNENGVVTLQDNRHSLTLPEVSSAPSWFEFSFLLTFADEADMVIVCRDTFDQMNIPGGL